MTTIPTKTTNWIIWYENSLFYDLSFVSLCQIEESILESLAWRHESPLWEAIKESSVPGCEDVVLPSEHDVMKASPVKHPAVIRVTEAQQQQHQKKGTVC